MSEEQKQIELFHDIGRMPDFAYYQLNGKTAQENYNQQRKKRQQQALESYLLRVTENNLASEVEKSLDKIFRDFSFR